LTATKALNDPVFLGCDHLQLFPKLDRVLGTSTNNNLLHLWEFTTGKHQMTIDIGITNFFPDHLSPNGRWLLGFPRHSRGLRLYDLRATRRVEGFSFNWRWAYGAAFSPDSQWLVISHQNPGTAGAGTVHNQNRGTAGVITAWDLHRGRIAHTFGESQTQITCLALSPDGQILASGGFDRTVRLWSFPAGTPLHPPLEGHLAWVAQVAFSADGKTLASVGSDGLRLWNVAAGRETLVFEDAMMAAGTVRSIASSSLAAQAEFNPLDRFFIWQEFDGPIHVATLPTLQEIDGQAIPPDGR
jgi:WD40 repeat protein